jgi:long-subunit acyl-CoA synthetase (AMP-forming)
MTAPMTPVVASAPASTAGHAPPADCGSLGQMLLDAAARHRGVALQYRRNGQTISISYPELGTITTEIARGLVALGLQPGDRVSILGATSAEWTLADFGAPAPAPSWSGSTTPTRPRSVHMC